jgi:hypothetical protein
MSSKKRKEAPQSITIDTTTLKINIKSTGDLITKDYDLLPFHPNMADLRDLSNNSYILFPSFVKITMKDLKNAGVGEDYPKVFMNLDKYIKLIKYVTSPDRAEDFTLFIDKTQVKNYSIALAQNALTDLMADNATDIISIQKYEPLTEQEIITNNIEIIKNIFLPVKSHFFILGNDYVIGQSKFKPPYIPSTETNLKLSDISKKIPLAYTVTFELQLLDAANNPDAGNFSKMSCKAKKANIAKDSMDIFGTNFGYVPEKKAMIPSILNTSKTTQNRQFSKLQKEWEERNKYVKAPANERERIAMEKNWTPLQRKMAEFDKKQEAYNKIPPLWIKEKQELEAKYKDFTAEMVKLWQELKDVEKSNTDASGLKKDSFVKDLLDGVKLKMKEAAEKVRLKVTEPLTAEQITKNKTAADALSDASITLEEMKQLLKVYTTTKAELQTKTDTVQITKYEEEINKLADQLAKLAEINALIKTIDALTLSDKPRVESTIVDSTFFKNEKALEENAINDKYTKTLVEGTGLAEKEIDLRVLREQEVDLTAKIERLMKSEDPSDRYNVESVKTDLAKLQADIRRKLADIEVIKQKYDTKNIITGWKKTLGEMDSISKTVEREKTKDEKKIKNETMNKVLDEKLKEIRNIKKELLLAKFFEGDYDDLSKSEKESYEKKSQSDRPLDSVNILQQNLDAVKEQYLEMANEFSPFNKVQALITLLNDDLTAIKKLKDSKKSERESKDRDIKTKNSDKLAIARQAESAKRDLTPADEEKLKNYDKDIAVVQNELNEKIIPIFEKTEERRKIYDKYIDALKKIDPNDTTINTLLITYEGDFKKLTAELNSLINEKKRKRQANAEEIKPIIDTINDLQKKVQKKKKDLKSTRTDEEKDTDLIKLKEEVKEKNEELTTKNEALEADLRILNENYESALTSKFAKSPSTKGGGSIMKKTRKRKRHTTAAYAAAKRYILKKNKIVKKKKTAHNKRKKYTLRRRR